LMRQGIALATAWLPPQAISFTVFSICCGGLFRILPGRHVAASQQLQWIFRVPDAVFSVTGKVGSPRRRPLGSVARGGDGYGC
jgi:hypothetical protein